MKSKYNKLTQEFKRPTILKQICPQIIIIYCTIDMHNNDPES